MNERLPGPRRYTEKEVGLILRRATEMQGAEPSALDPTGLTLGELEDIAAEAGIDPVLLRQAANELHVHRPETLGSRLAGALLHVDIERVIEGELPWKRVEELVPTIQASVARQGTASAVGRTLTWTSRTEENALAQQVVVSVRGGQTFIRNQESLGGLAAGLFGGIMGGVGAGVGFGVGGALSTTLGLVAGLVALPLATITGSYFLARAIFTAQVPRRQAAAQSLVDRLAEQVESAFAEERAGLPFADLGALPPAPRGGDNPAG
jgi:hypothetical protein